MLASLRKKLLVIGSALLLAAPFAAPVSVLAANDTIGGNLACGTTDLAVPDASKDCKSQLSGGTGRINKIITQAINIFSVVVGIIAVIMIIVGGFKYITSGGDSGNISSAKNTIIYAVIGLVIVALAQFLVQFVLDKATN